MKKPLLKHFFKKALLISLACAGLFVAKDCQRGIGLEQYAKENLSKIAQEQEARIGIRHTALPSIELYQSDEINIPGNYNPINNFITLNEKLNNYSSGNIFSRIIGRFNNNTNNLHVDRVLSHELGHAYLTHRAKELRVASLTRIVDALGEKTQEFQQLRTNFQSERTGKNRKKLNDFTDAHQKAINISFGLTVINEGISEYFRRGNANLNFKADWPEDLKKITLNQEYYLQYFGGYQLVKPIISKYGARGIDAILKNPPMISKPSELPAYAEAVLNRLKQESAKK
jgi:hypothetical protein